jgi:hypothetical protein
VKAGVEKCEFSEILLLASKKPLRKDSGSPSGEDSKRSTLLMPDSELTIHGGFPGILTACRSSAEIEAQPAARVGN